MVEWLFNLLGTERILWLFYSKMDLVGSVLFCVTFATRITTGLCLFAVCQGHTAKAGLHSAKCLPSITHGKTTAGKELVCRVLHLGHTANTLPCAILGPRQNKVQWQNKEGQPYRGASTSPTSAPKHVAHHWSRDHLIEHECRHPSSSAVDGL